MPYQGSRRALQAVLAVVGAVATGTGLSVLATGTRVVPGGAPVSPSTDSVLRFYASWWAALGPVAWRVVPRVEQETATVRAICAVTFLGGIARLVAAQQSGRPHPLFRALTVFELVAPPLITMWQDRIAADGRAGN